MSMRRVVVWAGACIVAVGCHGPRPPAVVEPSIPPAPAAQAPAAPTAALRGVIVLERLRSERVSLTLAVPDDVALPAGQPRPAPHSLDVGEDGTFFESGIPAVRHVLTVRATGRLEQRLPVVLEPD
jgi:hypothetical protein